MGLLRRSLAARFYTRTATASLSEALSHRNMIQPEQLSSDVAKRHLLELRDALEAMRRGREVSVDSVAWPAGLDRAVLRAVPLRVRTRNCLQNEGLLAGANSLTANELLRIRHFGRTSLRDLLSCVEEFLTNCVRNGGTVSSESSESGLGGPTVAEGHLSEIRGALGAMRNGHTVSMDSIVWPSGLDRSLLRTLPLQVRTWGCLQGEGLLAGINPLTAGELLRIRNFGWKSLRDLLSCVDEFLTESVRNGAIVSLPHSELGEGAPNPLTETDLALGGTEPASTPWASTGQILSPLLASVAELHGAKTLADVLSPECARLAGKLGITDAVDSIMIADLAAGVPGLVSTALARLAHTIDAASGTERAIVECRLLREPPLTLESVGLQVGLTRERIRQAQRKLETKIGAALADSVGVIASTLQDSLGHVLKQGEFERRIDRLLPADHEITTDLLRRALVQKMGFRLDKEVYLDERARRELEDIETAIRGFADDVGLLNEQEAKASLPSEEWHQVWPWLCERLRLKSLHGVLALRDTAKAKAKAALLSIGRPATREEIGSLCGLEESRVGGTLSNIESVVRADKERWGLREWVDDEYDGIVGEIIQRIEEDGGTTTTQRLLTELPSKFDVSPVSVRAYMQTAKFEIRDGWISLANTSALQLRALDDVIDGRDDKGAPYWTFGIEPRFFDGYSLPGVPPELAKVLGCAPDAAIRVQIENLPQCRELSIRWPLSSPSGASLGYLAEPLRELGLTPGQRARLTVKGPHLVELSSADAHAEESELTEADAILERLIQRRRLL